MSAAKGFLSIVLERLQQRESSTPPTRLSRGSSEDPAKAESLARRRADMALEMLSNQVFQEAIQFLNEQVVEEIAACDPLDTDRLVVLRLRLGTISDFPQALSQMIDNYELIMQIRAQQDKRDNASEAA
jgi:hypothetical protein